MHSGSLEPTEPMCSNKSRYTAANSHSQLHSALKPMDSGLLKPGRHSLKRNGEICNSAATSESWGKVRLGFFLFSLMNNGTMKRRRRSFSGKVNFGSLLVCEILQSLGLNYKQTATGELAFVSSYTLAYNKSNKDFSSPQIRCYARLSTHNVDFDIYV